MRAGFRTLPFGVKLPWFRLQPGWSQSTVLHALVKFQQLLNNPPVSSACHKAGRNPRTGASGLAQRCYIDPYYVFSWWSWFTFGVCVPLRLNVCLCVCVCVSIQQALFGSCLTSYLLSSPRGANVSVWPCRAILPLKHTHWELIGPQLLTHAHLHTERHRRRKKTKLNTHFYADCSFYFICQQDAFRLLCKEMKPCKISPWQPW